MSNYTLNNNNNINKMSKLDCNRWMTGRHLISDETASIIYRGFCCESWCSWQ